MPVMRDVFSSHVNRIGHDPATGDLHVTWNTGKTSVYSGVPQELANAVMNDWSVGTALTTHIKAFFPHKYLRDE